MALAEVKAVFDILIKVGEMLVNTSNAYYRASDELRAFSGKVADLNLKQKEWETLLQQYAPRSDHPVFDQLRRAKEMLIEEQDNVEKLQNRNCCLRFCTKVTFPGDMIANLDKVVTAFDAILQGLKDEKAATDLLREEANKRLAPFSFSMDDKYVPIMETVNDIEAALASDDPSGTMVLLHGESGRGKSTMVKYLALKFQEEMKQDPRNCKFPGGIYFFACGKSTDKLVLMEQLWKDLGFDCRGSNPMLSGMSADGHQQQSDGQQFQFDNLRRKVMAELKLRDSQSKPMLIIIDNVWERDVINAMRIAHKHVKYLVTSQKTYPDMTAIVRLAKPSLAEARQILRKHSGTWTQDTRLDPQVQTEMDGLIKQADFNTLVLANLGAYIKGKDSAYSTLAPVKLRELKQSLYHLLNHMDEDTLEATAFLETYKQTIEASMTLVLDALREEAKIMVYLMVICEDITMDEIVLKVWFYRLYGKSAHGDIKYSSALDQLKTQSIILFESEKVSWRQEPWTRWSIHELRRQFIREKRKRDLEQIIEKLVEKDSEKEDDDLVAVLCLLHGDATCYKRVLSVSCLQVHSELRKRTPWSTDTRYHTFIKSFDRLLHPTGKDEWQKKSHKSAKQIMLCAVEFLGMGGLDEIISQLLWLPETDLATCSALQSYPIKSSALQEVVRVLARKVHKCLDGDINSDEREKLRIYLQTLGNLDHDQQIVPNLPETLNTLLQQSQHVEISISVFLVLESLTCKLTQYFRRILSVPHLLETLIRFSDKDKYPDLFKLSVRILYVLLRYTEWGGRDHHTRASFAAIPNALQCLIDLLPFTITAAPTLKILVSTVSIAEKIASTPATLRSLLHLLSADNDARVIQTAVQVLETLSEGSSRKFICASSEAMERLVELVNGDIFMKCHNPSLPSWDISVSRRLANLVILTTNSGKEFKDFLLSALEKLVALLADGVNGAVQLEAVDALGHLASKPAICRSILQTYPEIGNQLLRLMNENAGSNLFKTLIDAFHIIVIKSTEFEDSWTDCVNEAIKQYVRLLDFDKLQEGAARALGKLALKVKTCRLLDSSTVQKLVGLIRKDTSSSTLKHVTNTVGSILLKDDVMSDTEQCVLISGALKRYVALLDDDVKQELKSESARALAIFASFTTPRNLIVVKYPGALQKLAGIIRIDGIPSILSNMAYLVETVTVRGTKLEDPVRSFFSAALEKYVALLAVTVEQKLQNKAVRALGKLAFNETARKLFCRSPDAVRLLGLLKGSFDYHTLKHLALAVDKLLLSSGKFEERSTILVEVMARYIQLLGEEVQQAVKVQALQALATLCRKDNARRLFCTLPGVVDRIIGLLDVNLHANHAFLDSVAELIEALAVGGANLTDKAAFTFLLDVTERLCKLLAQVDGAEWRALGDLLTALERLAVYPTFSRIMLSHPDTRVQLKKLLVDDGTPSVIFVRAAGIASSINFKRSDLDQRITAEFLSVALGSYITPSSFDDVDTCQPCRQMAARILENLTSEPATPDQVTISPMFLARRLAQLLDTDWSISSLFDDDQYIQLYLMNDSSTYVNSPAHELDGQSKLVWAELRFKALNNSVALLGKPSSDAWSKAGACRIISHLFEPAPDHDQLVSECPSITEQLLATIAWCEEASILPDIDGQMSSNNEQACTFHAMTALTLINPSSADEIVLSSSAAYEGRAWAKLRLKMYQSALADINKALDLSRDPTELLRTRAYIRTQLSDYSGASNDLHRVVNLDPGNGFFRRELGVLERIMGKLNDALVHLDLAVDLIPVLGLYDLLRQRGYVKFLLGDEEGARADAERAMLCKTVLHSVPHFGYRKATLASSPVNYLHFAL